MHGISDDTFDFLAVCYLQKLCVQIRGMSATLLLQRGRHTWKPPKPENPKDLFRLRLPAVRVRSGRDRDWTMSPRRRSSVGLCFVIKSKQSIFLVAARVELLQETRGSFQGHFFLGRHMVLAISLGLYVVKRND